MALKNLHTNWKKGSYHADRDYAIKWSESAGLASGNDLSDLSPHWDGGSSIAVGYGLDLLVNSNDAINSYLTSAGLATLSVQDMAFLDEARVRRSAGTADQAYLENIAGSLSLSLPSEPSASTLLQVKVTEFESQLNNRLGYTMPDTRERAALISLAYNGGIGIIDKELQNAIKTDNRAEAWYQIRFNSNLNDDPGTQKRRTYEADTFGLWDGVVPTWDEIKEFAKMLKKHAPDIANDTARYGGEIDASNGLDDNVLEKAVRDFGLDPNDITLEGIFSQLNMGISLESLINSKGSLENALKYFGDTVSACSDGSLTMSQCRQLFTTAKTTASPIVLDLDGDGVETTGVTAGAYFDHDGNGFAEQTGWAGADDGILKDRQMAMGKR